MKWQLFSDIESFSNSEKSKSKKLTKMVSPMGILVNSRVKASHDQLVNIINIAGQLFLDKSERVFVYERAGDDWSDQ